MTTRPVPPLKSIPHAPTGPDAARTATPAAAVGVPESAARQGVRTVLRSDPRRGDGRYPVGWLTVRAPYGATPSAESVCLCGRDQRALGISRVLALIADHDDHRTACPLRMNQEGRAAA
jgi:hypothetical protein